MDNFNLWATEPIKLLEQETLDALTSISLKAKDLYFNDKSNKYYCFACNTLDEFAVNFSKEGFLCASSYYFNLLSQIADELPCQLVDEIADFKSEYLSRKGLADRDRENNKKLEELLNEIQKLHDKQNRICRDFHRKYEFEQMLK